MFRTIVTVLVVFLAAACATTDRPAEVDNPAGLPLYYLDDDAAEAVSFPNYRAERLPSGHLSIAFTCMGRDEKRPTVIDWKVVFFDTQRMPMDQTEWHTEYLRPNDVKMLQATSIRTDSAAFQVQIRTPYGVKRKK